MDAPVRGLETTIPVARLDVYPLEAPPRPFPGAKPVGMRIPRHFFEGYFTSLEPYLLSKKHKSVTYRKGELPFYKSHYQVNMFFYIRSGTATVYGYTDQGDRKEMCCYSSGVFGVFVLREGVDSIYDSELMEALTDMEILLFERETVLEMLKESHEFVMRTIRFYNDLIALLSYYSLMHAYLPSETKLCDFLYMCYLYYPKAHDQHPEIIHVYQEQIANHIGVTRTQVTRLLKCLKAKGLIETGRGQIRLLCPDRLLTHCSRIINCAP